MPRDLTRIDRITALLRAYWLRHPDLRLGQIVSNAAYEAAGHETGMASDPYYAEDDKLEAALRAMSSR